MNIEITNLTPRHFDAVRQVLDHVAREKRFLAFTEAPPREAMNAFLQEVVDQRHVYSLVLADGAVIGWCDVLPMHGQARAHVGTLGMGLLPAMRHQGIGRKVIEHTIAQAQARGFSRIELSVRADNLNAKALYERVGFVCEGLMRQALRIDGVCHDAYAMALLGCGDYSVAAACAATEAS